VLRLLKWLFLTVLLFTLGSLIFYSIYPDIARLRKTNPSRTAFMRYRETEWQSKGKRVTIQQHWVKFSKISPYLVKAAIISEDDKFWKHHGFDFDAMEKAVERDIKAGSFKVGGSTISQQLVKNLYLSPSKNPLRKLVEAFLTWRMEHTLSKRRILELYLNVAEWGEGLFGVEAACLHYYGKSSAIVTATEAARLVAVLPNPIRFSVNSNSRSVERRANLIYRVMVKRGIVVEEYEEAAKEPETPLQYDAPEEPHRGVDSSQ
jgi:monofunctional glycosyltransferase